MRHIALGLTSSLFVSLFLAACGTNGPLYQLPRQEPQSPLFVKAGEKLGLMPTAADVAACRPLCVAACPTSGPDGTILAPVKPWPEALAGASAVALKTPASCQAACMSKCPPGFAASHPAAVRPDDSKAAALPAAASPNTNPATPK